VGLTSFTKQLPVVVGLSNNLTIGGGAVRGPDCAENNDWRAAAASRGAQFARGRTCVAAVTFGIQHDQVRLKTFRQVDRLIESPRFQRCSATVFQKDAQYFARFRRLVDN
jgi:hypothetical protein